MKWLILAAFALTPLLSYGQEVKPDEPKPDSKIIVPVFPAPVTVNDPIFTPTPAPIPAIARPTLLFGQLYVIQSDVNFVVCVSPPELAKPHYETGPIKIRGVFTDSLGDVETRTFASKYVVTVEVAKGANGEGEILIYPEGTKSEEGVMRIKVRVGQGPRPPPIPDDPKPDEPDPPKPDTPVVVSEFRVIWVLDPNQKLTRGQLNATSSTVIWKWLMENCTKGPGDVPEWRKWAPSQEVLANESPALKEIWSTVKADPTLLTPTPKMIVVVNKDAKVYDQPATPEATLEFLKLKREGK